MATKAATKPSTKPVATEADLEVVEESGWAFLGKEPSILHADLAAYIEEETEGAVEISARQVQAVLAMHKTWQKTDRVARRRRKVESILKGGATVVERFEPRVQPEKPKPAPRKRAPRATKPKAVEAASVSA